jgi:hypothetical protein
MIRLAKSVGYRVTFQGDVFSVTKDTAYRSKDKVVDLLNQVRQLLKARGRSLTDGEMEKILQVVKVMVSWGDRHNAKPPYG